MLVWAVVVAAALALFYAVWVFNRLMSLKVRSRNAWSDIDVQLKRRWDLVPGLVQTVRGYAAHEQRTLEGAVAARVEAQHAHNLAERGAAESHVGREMHQLIAIAEAYPELKASEMFRSLHDNLVEVEDHLQSARRYYNAVARDFNTLRKQWPHALVAALFRFEPLEFFNLDDRSEANAPVVSFQEQ